MICQIVENVYWEQNFILKTLSYAETILTSCIATLPLQFTKTLNQLFHWFCTKRQSFLKYFETFWCFTKFVFHCKWNDAQLLIMNMVYTSCLTSSQTT